MNTNEDRPDLAEAEASEAAATDNGEASLMLAPEDYPDVSNLVTEDGAAVDSIYTEKQYRLLTDALETSWQSPSESHSFVALTNVGLFSSTHRPALVLDFLLSDDVELPQDLRDKEHRSYFMWVFDKPPDLVGEIVSDRRGGEETYKLRRYARLGIKYYAIYDPDNILGHGVLRVIGLQLEGYPLLADNWLPSLGLGLRVWHGVHSGAEEDWLRWCNREGQVLLTSRELAEQERQRADQEQQRADAAEERLRRLEAQLRAAGIDPAL
jgi:Uma2 family endonuclease